MKSIEHIINSSDMKTIDITRLKNKIAKAFTRAANNDITHEELEKEVARFEKTINLLDRRLVTPRQKTDPADIDIMRAVIREMKILFFIYDEELELDLMFPNRHDENFDMDAIYDFDFYYEDD
jgi:hypothetical protein